MIQTDIASMIKIEQLVRTSITKSGKDLKFGYVNIYKASDFDDLMVLEFPTTDAQWLHCVCAHRKPRLFDGGSAKWDAYEVAPW